MAATPFLHCGQRGWAHDEGHRAGTFHTYDALDVGRQHAPRKVHVFLPRGWETAGQPYPLVLLHDGDTAFWPGGVANDTWDVAGTLSALARHTAPVIAVAVHPIDRNHEYTHEDWSAGRRSWGGLPAHARYLAEEVLPWLRRAYPIADAPDARAVVGSSHGGLSAFWTATRHPDAFGRAACLSPSFFSGIDPLAHPPRPTGPPLADAALVAPVRDLLADHRRRPTLWVCWGGQRTGGDHNAVVEALAAERAAELIALCARLGYDAAPWSPAAATAAPTQSLRWATDPAHGHSEAAWRTRFGWLMRAWFHR
jgi:hypothetical protein